LEESIAKQDQSPIQSTVYELLIIYVYIWCA